MFVTINLSLKYADDDMIGEGEPTEVIIPLSNYIACDGEPVRFECKISGNPKPNIVWFHNSRLIRPSPDFLQFHDMDNNCSLTVREVFPEDAGRYTVLAKNMFGIASSSAELTVQENESFKGRKGKKLPIHNSCMFI